MQTSGRGGHQGSLFPTWEKKPHLFCVLHPQKPASEIQIYSLLASVVVARVLKLCKFNSLLNGQMM
ncbi:MAG: hypothetical protein CM1200mP28_17570 [Deltaproteobacteria bacterium]|nr:MAG: hypothetical protein CM1200mP28_17570 [Deltaproteobacteria bacterium]